MNRDSSKTDRLIAALVTLLVSVLAVGLLCVVTISVAPGRLLEPTDEEPDDEILFTDVELKAIPYKPVKALDNKPAASSAAEVSGTDADDSGAGEESAPLISTPDPQPAKQEAPKEEPKPVAKPQPKPDPQAEAAARIRNRVGKSNVTKADEGSGKADKGNSPQSQTNSSAATGLGMDGRQLLNSPKPQITNAQGTVKVSIAVNAAGTVTEATFVSSTGFGTREQEVRSACIAASRQLRYSAAPDKPLQRGTITWRIK